MPALFYPSLSHRFHVTFAIAGVPSLLDVDFQQVSGLSRALSVRSFQEGGDNVGSLHLPERVTHGNLVLKRGVMPVTPLTALFSHMLDNFKCVYADVVILLLNERLLPKSSWTIDDALPVRWHTADLDARGNTVLIDTLELAYHKIRWIGPYA